MMRATSAALPLLAPLLVVAWSTPSQAKPASQTNHLRSVTVRGATTVLWTQPKGHSAPVAMVKVPAVDVVLTCGRSGFRPQQVTLGVGPMQHAVHTGRAVARRWRPKKGHKPTRSQRMGPFTMRERGPPARRRLGWLTTAARKRCVDKKGAATVPLTLVVTGRCQRVKGFGSKVASITAERKVQARIVCEAGPAPAARKRPAEGARRPRVKRKRP